MSTLESLGRNRTKRVKTPWYVSHILLEIRILKRAHCAFLTYIAGLGGVSHEYVCVSQVASGGAVSGWVSGKLPWRIVALSELTCLYNVF